jgi:hypothetical protein
MSDDDDHTNYHDFHHVHHRQDAWFQNNGWRYENGFVFEGTIRNLFIAFVVGLMVAFFMFVILP